MASLTKAQIRKYELAELTEKSARLFDLDMTDFAVEFSLEPVVVKEWDIIMVWDDVKDSVGYVEHEGDGKFGRGLKVTEWNNPDAYAATQQLLKKHFKEASEVYPIELTARLLKWYAIFKPAVLDLPCYEPTELDYRHYFALRGNGTKIEQLEGLIGGGGILFYYLIHRLYFHQAQGKRQQTIRYMLSDPDIVQQLRDNSFVVPANLQFLITTPQIYSAFGKALLEGKILPLPTPREEAKKEMGKSGYEAQKEREKLFREVLDLQKRGYAITLVSNGKDVGTLQ